MATFGFECNGVVKFVNAFWMGFDLNLDFRSWAVTNFGLGTPSAAKLFLQNGHAWAPAVLVDKFQLAPYFKIVTRDSDGLDMSHVIALVKVKS